jgi:hypothetical protein
MAAATTMGHLQRLGPLRAQFGRGLTADLVPLLVLKHPFALLRVDPDPDPLAAPQVPGIGLPQCTIIVRIERIASRKDFCGIGLFEGYE